MNKIFNEWIKDHKNATEEEVIQIIKLDKNKMKEIERQQEIFREAKKQILKYINNKGKDVRSELIKILNELEVISK